MCGFANRGVKRADDHTLEVALPPGGMSQNEIEEALASLDIPMPTEIRDGHGRFNLSLSWPEADETTVDDYLRRIRS